MTHNTQQWPITDANGVQIGYVTREQYERTILWASRAMDGTNLYTSGSRNYAQSADVIKQINKYMAEGSIEVANA